MARDEELFVEFVNTLEYSRGEPQDHVADIDSLLSWLRDHELVSARGRAAEAGRLRRRPDEAERRLQRYSHLREVLRALVTELADTGAADAGDIAELNHILRHGLHYHQLRHVPGEMRYEVAQVGDRLDQARATIANSFANYLASNDPGRLRVCDNPGCRYVFVDHSPAGRRRWCDMRTCGNQAKVAAHRARQKAQEQNDGARA